MGTRKIIDMYSSPLAMRDQPKLRGVKKTPAQAERY
jgi:hypothetical protein